MAERTLGKFTVSMRSLAPVAVLAVTTTVASAQGVPNLTGPYQCVQNCAGPGVAFVTQNGWDLNLTNEIGQPSRAWIDYPGHIWVQYRNEGAIYSPDGMTIQFDRGTVWRREIGQPVPAVPVPPSPPLPAPSKKANPARTERAAAATNAFDGNWSVVILTRTGDCDPAYRVSLRISNGYIVNDIGDSVNLQGRVWPNGAVRVNVSAGGQYASGEGRMSPMSGTGTWQGVGSGRSCGGDWQAARHG